MSILDDNPTIRLGFRATQIIVYVLFGGVVLFLGIASVLVASGRMEAAENPLLAYVLPVAGVLGITTASVLRVLILRRARAAAESAPEGAPVRLFEAWRAATILMAAAIEGAALMCAVAAIVDGQTVPIMIGCLFAALLLLHVPTESRLEQFLQSV